MKGLRSQPKETKVSKDAREVISAGRLGSRDLASRQEETSGDARSSRDARTSGDANCIRDASGLARCQD